MGEILAAILLLSATDVAWGRHNHGSGHGNGQWVAQGPYVQPPPFQNPPFQMPPGHARRTYPFENYQWYSQQQQQQQNAFIEASLRTAEWVCRNPKSGDMVIVSSNNSHSRNPPHAHQHPGQQPSYGQRQPNYPSQNGGSQNNPINEQQSSLPGHSSGHPTNVNPVTLPTNSQQAPQVNNNGSTPYHGGEGLIDIRMGTN